MKKVMKTKLELRRESQFKGQVKNVKGQLII